MDGNVTNISPEGTSTYSQSGSALSRSEQPASYSSTAARDRSHCAVDFGEQTTRYMNDRGLEVVHRPLDCSNVTDQCTKILNRGTGKLMFITSSPCHSEGQISEVRKFVEAYWHDSRAHTSLPSVTWGRDTAGDQVLSCNGQPQSTESEVELKARKAALLERGKELYHQLYSPRG